MVTSQDITLIKQLSQTSINKTILAQYGYQKVDFLVTKLKQLGYNLIETEQGFGLDQTIDWLDIDIIIHQLIKNSIFNKDNIQLFSVIPSTNTQLLTTDFIKSQVCLAETQTAGRGQQGKAWYSPLAKNIYLSIGCYITHPPPSFITLVIGIILAEYLNALCHQAIQSSETIQVKWPNDLFYQGKKLGGILVESQYSSEKYKLVIGLGLNIAMSDMPTNNAIEQAWIDLKSIGCHISRNTIVVDILNIFSKLLQNLSYNYLAEYLKKWPDYDMLLGKTIVFKTPSKQLTGIVQGINQQGSLNIKIDQQIKAFSIGEVFIEKLK